MQYVIYDLTNRLRGIESDIDWYTSIKPYGRVGSSDIEIELSYLRSKHAQYERALSILKGVI